MPRPITGHFRPKSNDFNYNLNLNLNLNVNIND
jgi:hypothetical protein